MSLNNKSDRDKKKCADKIRKSMVKFNSGKITVERMFKIINDCGYDSDYWTLAEQQNLTDFIDKNRRLVESQYDDNSNRDKGSTHNPYFTSKGKLFHTTVKQSIRKSIDLAVWLIKNKYDENAFVYDDPRLKDLDDFLNEFIEARFQHRSYKIKLMHQIRHIVCFMIKEDPYYTSVAWDGMNQFIKRYPNGFELTKSEQFNLDNYHVGTEEEIQERIRASRESLESKKP